MVSDGVIIFSLSFFVRELLHLETESLLSRVIVLYIFILLEAKIVKKNKLCYFEFSAKRVMKLLVR